jgi:hypothetical protein
MDAIISDHWGLLNTLNGIPLAHRHRIMAMPTSSLSIILKAYTNGV